MSVPIAYDPLSRLVNRRPLAALQRGRTALLTIDMDYGDVHPDFGLGALARRKGMFDEMASYYDAVTAIVPRIRALQDTARTGGFEVIHTRWAELTRDARDACARNKSRGIAQPWTSQEAQIVPDVAPVGDEMVFSKSTSSAFIGTNIDRVLGWMGIDTLVMVGVVTNGCVEMTARVAADMGYRVVLVGDACAAHTAFLHENALRRMDDGYIYVGTTDEVRRALQAADGDASAPPARAGVGAAGRGAG
jgi:ureidoacrylate peracid hydrolase